ncbi:Calcineurin-like protein phosphoesterase, partial [Leptotrombidium deliense]
MKSNKKSSTTKSIGFPARRSPSLESTQSISSGSTKTGYETASLSPLAGIPPELFGEVTYDCCSFVIFCEKHNKIAMTTGNASWLPFVVIKSVDTWATAALSGSAYVLSHGEVEKINQLSAVPFLNPELVEICRIQVPQQPKLTNRLMYVVRVNNEVKDFKCCTNDKKIEWIDRNQLKSGHENLWGPEPHLFADNIEPRTSSVTKKPKKTLVEFSIDDALQHCPREPPRTHQELMVKSAGIGEREILKIYLEFVEHCFPCLYMTPYSFTNFMLKLGCNKEDFKTGNMFRAFKFTETEHISFQELLLGLAAMEQATHHGGEIG